MPSHIGQLDQLMQPATATQANPNTQPSNLPDSKPSANDDAVAIALAHVKANAGLLGLTQTDLTDYVVTDKYTSQDSGVTHVYLQQVYQGIPVYNAILNVNVTAKGDVLNAGSRFVPNLSSAVAANSVQLTAEDAVFAAVDQLGLKTSVTSLTQIDSLGGPTQVSVYGGEGLSLEDITVGLVYQPVKENSVRLAWDLTIYELDAKNWWSVRVDATTGKMLDQNNLVVHDDWAGHQGESNNHSSAIHTPQTEQRSPLVFTQQDNLDFSVSGQNSAANANKSPDEYFVYTPPAESPNHVFGQHDPPLTADLRSLAVNPATANASPFGWHDTDGISGTNYTITRGNNVHAYEDSGNNNSSLGNEPDGGASLVFSYTLDLTQAPATYQDAAVTNLFYWNNIIHDVFHEYGFDEVSGNFQVTNYTGDGLGNDWVQAEAQDGSGNCNANFGTPPDGSLPRMQMYTCTNATPTRDGDLDNGVIVHEYGHGISNRLTGGPSTTSCLNNAEQMGEGWSDYLATWITIEPGDTGPDARGMGTYLFGEASTGPGIRLAPYSTDFGVNNYTYQSIASCGGSPHCVGFHWATMLWDMNWAFVDQYGLDLDIYNGTGGNNLAMQLVMDGMKLQPCSPGFVDGRDAILAADQALTGGANQCLIWKAFADRGLGFSADQGSSSSIGDGTEAFDLPLLCQATIEGTVTDSSTTDPLENALVSANPSTTTDANGDYILGVVPGVYTVTFSAFGYATDAVTNVVAITDTATTVDMALAPLPSVVVSGTVTDGTTGWPLYATVDIEDSAGQGISVWNDPVSGYYSASVPSGTVLTFTTNAWVQGYDPGLVSAGPFVSDSTVDITLNANQLTCNAPGYTQTLTVILTETFTSGITGTWQTIDNSGGSGCDWVDNDPSGRGNNTGGAGLFAINDSDFCGSGTSTDAELRSPVFDASGFNSLIVEYKTDYNDLGSTANVDVSGNSGTNWTNAQAIGGANVTGPSTQTVNTSIGAGSATAMVRWHYVASWDWWWEVDDVYIYGANCVPTAGSLVVGNVYDNNTLNSLDGADVANEAGYTTVTTPTSDDAVDDGFYTLFSPAGSQVFTASMSIYDDEVITVTVAQSDTVRQDFYLKSGFLTTPNPAVLSVTVKGGLSTTVALTLSNLGTGNSIFELVEKNGGVVDTALTADFKSLSVIGVENSASVEADNGIETISGQAVGTSGADLAPLPNPWVVIPAMPIGTSRPAGAVVDGKFYVIGGEESGGGLNGHVQIYDPDTGMWDASSPTMPTGLSNLCTAAIGDEIYVPGGYNGASGITDLQVFDTDSNTWSVVATDPLPTASFGSACASYDDKLYVFGGDAGGSLVYDPASPAGARWSTLTSPPVASSYGAALAVGDLIFYSGLGVTSDLADVYAYDPVTDSWITYPNLTSGRGGAGMWAIGDTLYVGGGGWSSYLTSVEEYDTSLGTGGSWTATNPLLQGRRTFAWASSPETGRLYVGGGWAGAYLNEAEETAFPPIFSDIPWLSEDPITGTINANTDTVIDVTFSATLTNGFPITPGIYYGTLVVNNDNLMTNTYNIPVTMTVPTYFGAWFDPPTDADNSPAGTTVSYTLQITNTGSATDTFDLSVVGNNWPTTLGVYSGTGTVPLPQVGPLARGEGATIGVWVNIPADAYGNAVDVANILATSQADATEVTTATLRTTADAYFGLERTPLSSVLSGLPGETVTFTVWLSNTGNTTDTYDVDLTSEAWTSTGPGSTTLDRYTGDYVNIAVDIPASANNNDSNLTLVDLTSQGDNALTELSALVTLVQIDYGVVVDATDNDMSGVIGTSVMYSLWVTNTGDVTDTFNLSVEDNVWPTGLSLNGSGSLPLLTVNLNAGAGTMVYVIVEIPYGVDAGDIDLAKIVATSQGDANVSGADVLITTALPIELYLPLVLK